MKHHLPTLLLLLTVFATWVRAEESPLRQVTFSHGLEENQQPKGKAESYLPDQPIYVSVELRGRPTKGEVSCRFLIEKERIAEAKVDLATVNAGVLASTGQSTFAGFHLSHEKPLPVGNIYRAEIFLDGKTLGSFPFRVSPPKDAIPSKLKATSFQMVIQDSPESLGAEAALAPEDEVRLDGSADMGTGTWLRTTWLVNGKPVPESTRSFTILENRPDCAFHFTFRPESGWPKGSHSVVLEMNGEVVARPTFEVKNTLPSRTSAEPGPVAPASFSLLKIQPATGERLAVGAFGPEDREFIAEWKLKNPAKAEGVKFIWSVVDAGGSKNEELATVIPSEGIYRALQTTLTSKESLPPGKYRVTLLLHDEVLDSRDFEVR